MLVPLTGGLADSAGQRRRQLQRHNTVHSGYAMVEAQLSRRQPANIGDDIGDVLVFPPSAQHTGSKIDKLLNPMDLGLVARTVYRHAIPDSRKDKCSDQIYQGASGDDMFCLVQGNQYSVQFSSVHIYFKSFHNVV